MASWSRLIAENTPRITLSTAVPPNLEKLKQPEKYRYLLQHFVGWEIETKNDVFDPATVEFMDFRGPQHHEARFMYVLPFAPRKALGRVHVIFGKYPCQRKNMRRPSGHTWAKRWA